MSGSQVVGHGDRKTVAWVSLKTFTDGDLVVELKKLPIARPKYSFTTLMKKSGGDFSTHVHCLININDGEVYLTDQAPRLATLVADAERFAYEDAKRHETAFKAQRSRSAVRK